MNVRLELLIRKGKLKIKRRAEAMPALNKLLWQRARSHSYETN